MQSPPAIWTLEPQIQTQSGAASPGEHLVEWACGGLKAPAPAMAITITGTLWLGQQTANSDQQTESHKNGDFRMSTACGPIG